jgi:hypothetical protein
MYAKGFMFWVLSILNIDTNQRASRLLHASWIHVVCLYTLIQPLVIHANVSNGGVFW